jgi:hypothetical protein
MEEQEHVLAAETVIHDVAVTPGAFEEEAEGITAEREDGPRERRLAGSRRPP